MSKFHCHGTKVSERVLKWCGKDQCICLEEEEEGGREGQPVDFARMAGWEELVAISAVS